MHTTHTFPLPVSGPVAAADPIAITTAPPALIWPGSDEYDTVRQAWNLAVDQRPAGVCVATGVEHVQGALVLRPGTRTEGRGAGDRSPQEMLPSLESTLLLRLALHEARSNSTR